MDKNKDKGKDKDKEKSSRGKREATVILLIPKEPDYKMVPLRPGGKDAQTLIDVRHDLLNSENEGGYAVFANCMNERDLVGEDDGPPKCIAVVKAGEPMGEFTLGINFDVYRRLSHAARRELLKMQMMRIPYGHFSDRMRGLIQRYGREIVERAGQMVISQLINPAILAEEGIVLPVPEMWEFERNLTTEEYCEKLAEAGEGTMPAPIAIIVVNPARDNAPAAIGAKVSGKELQKLLDELTDANGLTRIDSMAQTEVKDGNSLDGASRNFLNKVDQAMRGINESLKSQGFMAGEAAEWIEQLFRQPSVDWAAQLRGMHGRHLSTKRVISKRRPSRRSPPMKLPDGRRYSFYKGRKHDRSVDVLVIVDTSGSMGASELCLIESELKGIKNKGATVMLMQVDADVAKEPVEYTGYNSIGEFFGRGGTSFVPGFNYAHDMSPRPDYLVYFTDGYGTAPKTPSEIDTLWLLTPEGHSEEEFRTSVCDWGEIAKIDAA